MELRSVHDLQSLVRGRRTELGLTQAEVARRAGVSRKWLSTFEGGHEAAELGRVLALFHALDLRLIASAPAEDGDSERTSLRDVPGVDLRKTVADFWGDI